MQPRLIIIAGPSGVGKSTILQGIIPRFREIEKLRTITTRPPRPDEKDSYYFISNDEFEKYIRNNELIEWARVHDHYYGAKKSEIESMLDQGIFPIAAIDVQGVRSYKKIFPNLLAIFITYESLNELPKRLKNTRPDISKEELKTRLETAKQEMQAINEYTHIVINKENQLDNTIKEVSKIIEQELNIKP